jgi:hypothetical protein
MKIKLNLTDKEAGYLLASVIDFYHKMQDAESNDWGLVLDYSNKLGVAKSLWKKVDERINIDGNHTTVE